MTASTSLEQPTSQSEIPFNPETAKEPLEKIMSQGVLRAFRGVPNLEMHVDESEDGEPTFHARVVYSSQKPHSKPRIVLEAAENAHPPLTLLDGYDPFLKPFRLFDIESGEDPKPPRTVREVVLRPYVSAANPTGAIVYYAAFPVTAARGEAPDTYLDVTDPLDELSVETPFTTRGITLTNPRRMISNPDTGNGRTLTRQAETATVAPDSWVKAPWTSLAAPTKEQQLTELGILYETAAFMVEAGLVDGRALEMFKAVTAGKDVYDSVEIIDVV